MWYTTRGHFRAEYIADKLENGDDIVNELTKLTPQEEAEFMVARSIVTKFLGIEFEEEDISINDSMHYMSKFEQIFHPNKN